MEKVYSVTFMHYTNACEDTISNQTGDYLTQSNEREEYLPIGHEPFLVRDSELEKYSKFGGGYRSITFVGYMKTQDREGE